MNILEIVPQSPLHCVRGNRSTELLYPVPRILFDVFCQYHRFACTYTLFHENILKFFSNIIGLPEHRNKRKSVLEITKMYYFLNVNDKIIEQEKNKMAIHTHVIFRPRNAMLFLSNI